MTSSRKDSLAVLALLGLLVLFFPDLFFVKAAPLIGDSLEQHYPWAFQLAQSLKNFQLPFWTPLIQCGFPLVAESQVGAFYLPNLFLLGLLPFHAAYSYMNLLHWFIAGWGTYAYAKQMKLGTMASFVAAVIFVFGSAYGGAYYNMTSLKTICWFPVALYLLERYLEKSRGWFIFGIILVVGQSLTAGYLQMAVLTWFMFGAYALLRVCVFSEERISLAQKTLTITALTITAIFAFLLALPQIYLTFQLAMLSNRTGLEEGYAYVGSLSPVVLGTLINPNLVFVARGNLYAGSISVFLVLFAFCSYDIRRNSAFRLWGVMTLLAFLLSLGQWSPLYVLLIKLTKFYSFRIPAKFLGFICFGFAMLSATGFQALWQGRSTQAMVKKAFHVYFWVVMVFMALMATGNLFLTAGKAMALKFGEFFVTGFIYAKAGHPHSLEIYLDRVKSYPEYALNYISLNHPANLWTMAILAACMALLAFFSRKRIVSRFLLCLGLFFLTVDLYAASWLDIQLDLAPYRKVLEPSPVLKILGQEKAAGQLGRVYGYHPADRPLPFVPSQNMLYGIEDIGVYSPLVPKRYNETIGLLGNVNDSNDQQFPPPDFVLQRLSLLGFLNVSHILSAGPIEHPDLKLLGRDDRLGSFLYKNEGIHQPGYFFGQAEIVQNWDDLRAKLMAPQFDPKQTLLLEKEELRKINYANALAPIGPAANMRLLARRENFEEWQVVTGKAGFFVVPDSYFPGWMAQINDRPAPLLKAYGLFRAVRIDGPGNYRIRFRYNPFSKD